MHRGIIPCLPAVGTRILLAALCALKDNLLWQRLLGGCGRGLEHPLTPGDRILWLCILNTHTEPPRRTQEPFLGGDTKMLLLLHTPPAIQHRQIRTSGVHTGTGRTSTTQSQG